MAMTVLDLSGRKAWTVDRKLVEARRVFDTLSPDERSEFRIVFGAYPENYVLDPAELLLGDEILELAAEVFAEVDDLEMVDGEDDAGRVYVEWQPIVDDGRELGFVETWHRLK